MVSDPQSYGFDLTINDAAVALDTTPTEVRHLVRAGLLGYRSLPDLTGKGSSRLRFHLGELTAYAEAKKRGEIPVDRTNTARIARLLREYLEELEFEDDYETAMFKRTPLLASSKTGPQVYVKIELFIEHLAEYAGVTLVPSIVEASFEYLGAIRRRGIVPLSESGGGNKQRWATWWRVPPFLLPENDSDEQLEGSIVEAVIPGEKLQRSRELPRDGSGRVSGPIGKSFLDEAPLGTD